MSYKKKAFECFYCNYTADDEDLRHCPNCLMSTHITEDDDCGAALEPVGIYVDDEEKWNIVHRCRLCSNIRLSPVSDKDNPIKLMSIAAKPLAIPPFPIERMDELIAMLGGGGHTGGYFDE